MNNLTQEQINDITFESVGKLSDSFCRMMVAYMSGYLRMAQSGDDMENARQVYFQQIQHALKTNAQTVTFL